MQDAVIIVKMAVNQERYQRTLHLPDTQAFCVVLIEFEAQSNHFAAEQLSNGRLRVHTWSELDPHAQRMPEAIFHFACNCCFIDCKTQSSGD